MGDIKAREVKAVFLGDTGIGQNSLVLLHPQFVLNCRETQVKPTFAGNAHV